VNINNKINYNQNKSVKIVIQKGNSPDY